MVEYIIDVRKEKEKFSEDEMNIVNSIFGLFVKNVYFSMKAKINIKDNEKFINFAGISGVGKTIIKDEIKSKVPDCINVIDFDDLDDTPFYGKNIIEILQIQSSTDEILKILGGFGLFEMRILTQQYETLSQGQKTRLKYVYLFWSINPDTENYIFIDEFLTFVDDLSGISFASNVRRYLENKNCRLFTFGVNFNLVGQFDDVTFVLGNSTITSVIRNNKIEYLHDQEIFSDIEIKKLEAREQETFDDEW